MVGTWREGEIKTRPGAYYRRTSTGITLEGATNGILACVFASNYGELNKVVDVSVDEMNNLEELYGTGATILREGFLGGATMIRAVRVGSGGTCSSIMLKGTGTLLMMRENPTADLSIDDSAIARGDILRDDNDEPTEVNMVELSNKFEGNRAFSVTIRDNLITDQRELLILEGSDVVATFSFAKGGDEAGALVEAMKNNRYFVAKKKGIGVLSDVAQASMTAGTNPTVTTAAYSKGLDLLERYRWNVVVADSDEADIKSLLIAYVKQCFEIGRFGVTCIAGLSSQTFDERIAYAAAINDEKVVYVLSGWKSIDGTVYDGWRAAARIGGMIANVETNNSLTHIVISNALELLEPFTNGEMIRAEQKGCLVLSINDDDQIQIDNAINTLVTVGNDMDEGWKKIRRTKCRMELMDRSTYTCEKLVGRLNNDANGRATMVAAMQSIINEMVAEHKLVEGSYVEEDAAHAPVGDRAYFLFHILDIDSLEKIYSTFRFQFSQTFDTAA